MSDTHEELPPAQSPEPASRAAAIEHDVARMNKGTWALVLAGLAVLVLLVVFIVQNRQRATVSFFGAHEHLPLGAALLLSAVVGAVSVTLFGAAREFRLRRHLRGEGRKRTRRSR